MIDTGTARQRATFVLAAAAYILASFAAAGLLVGLLPGYGLEILVGWIIAVWVVGQWLRRRYLDDTPTSGAPR